MTRRTSNKKPPTAQMIFQSEYRAWINMLHRCHNPRHADYGNYGARGITVCDAWRDRATGFATFLADMGSKPDPALSLDRINNDEGYSRQNCRWADRKTQQNNRRPASVNAALDHGHGFGDGWQHRSPIIPHRGRKQTLAEWANEAGITPNLLRRRLQKGVPMERALKPERLTYIQDIGAIERLLLN